MLKKQYKFVTREKFVGCLLGLAVGDALGAPYEGLPAGLIRDIGPAQRLATNPENKKLIYTDDTEMMVGITETLIAHHYIVPEYLASRFAANFHPERGYGSGAHQQITMLQDGLHYSECLYKIFPNGSYGNGAAMRVAPVGLLFCHHTDRLLKESELSASVTHAHELGVEGANLIALAIATVLKMERFDRTEFFDSLLPYCHTEEFLWQMQTLRELERDALMTFGNGLEAHRSVVTAIQIFVDNPNNYNEIMRSAIGMGNDVDTLCAMSGAISGAYLGVDAIPKYLIDRLENDINGRDRIIELANQLYDIGESESELQ
jgi:poly(ADP-ribose) glycohydrolase ARH3